jgi:hypothetical protein
MKLKIYALLLGATALLFSNSAKAFTSLVVISKPATATNIKNLDPLSQISAKQFLSLTPKKFEEVTGKKMSLIKKIEFKMFQHKLKKMVKRGEVVTMADVQKEFDDLSTMNVLGFLLGLVLGPIGVVIALILKETGDVSQDVVRWSLYGLLVWLAIVLVVILI